jgi:acyl-homoserine lactone synthase
MLAVVTKHNAFLYRDALTQMFRLRHRIFVERMGWEALRRPDGMDKDQFDTAEAIYLILMDEEGMVMGSHRLLPTVRPHLFTDLFAEFCNVKGIQVGPKVYELNRTCVDEERLPRDKREWARKRIMAGLMEFGVYAGIEHFTILTPLDILFRYLLIGWDIKPLGVPREVDGVKQAAVAVRVDEAALNAVRDSFEIKGNLITHIGPLPVTGEPIEFLPDFERQRALVN